MAGLQSSVTGMAMTDSASTLSVENKLHAIKNSVREPALIAGVFDDHVIHHQSAPAPSASPHWWDVGDGLGTSRYGRPMLWALSAARPEGESRRTSRKHENLRSSFQTDIVSHPRGTYGPLQAARGGAAASRRLKGNAKAQGNAYADRLLRVGKDRTRLSP